MRLTDLILVIISHNNGEFAGRSLLQKAVFFLNELGNLGISFSPHYYGPYNMDVAVALENLICAGLLSETERYAYDWNVWGEAKKCTFRLTSDGRQILKEIKKSPDYKRIKDLLDKLGKFSEPKDYDRLSRVAKIYHIVKGKGKKVTEERIKKEVTGLGWNENDMSLFLGNLGLTRNNHEKRFSMCSQ